MKLSIESYIPTERFGIVEGCRLIKEIGFDCVDMSYYYRKEGCPLLSDGYREYAIQLKEQLDAMGLECNQAHAPFDVKYKEDFSLSNPNYRAVVRSIESAAILGAKTIVVHSIGYKEGIKDRERIFFDREFNLNYYKSLQPLCEKFGIKIAIENLFVLDNVRQCYRGRLGSASELCDFIRELDSDCFVACVDVGHAALTAHDSETFISEMDPALLKAVHIQDGDYRSDCHMLPYLGKFNWTAIMHALKAADYDGELTLEIIKYLGKVPTELLPDALKYAEKTGRQLISVFDES